ncbi:MAG: methyltransferase domain-containing protein [Bryobacteraceae bacterium]
MPISKWEERYRAGEGLDKPSEPLLVSLVEQLKPGRALDLACGAGRNALHLARAGWRVTAVDSSRAAMSLPERSAQELGLQVDTRVADLESGEFELEQSGFDLICNFLYLQRNLFPQIRAAVKPGGHVIAIVAMFDDDPDVRPMNPEFLLNPGELAGFFDGWEIIHSREGKPLGGTGRRMAELIARLPRA